MSRRDHSKDSDKVARGATLYSKSSKEDKTERRKLDPKSIKSNFIQPILEPELEDELVAYLSNMGIEVTSYKKRYILRRLRVRMGRLKIRSYKEYMSYLQRNPSEIEEIQHSLSINVTRFFRNRDTFEKLQSDLLPQIAHNKKAIKIWSAGCAVGAEPYTLAMIASESLPKTVGISILATDVKDELLRMARNGIYSNAYVAEMKDSEILKYFNKTGEGDYSVKPHIKSMVTFNRHDLMKEEYPHNLDLIICRNVLIYVDRKAQNLILNKFFKALKPDGYLVLGRTETLFGDWRKSVDIISTKHRIYQKKKADRYHEIEFQAVDVNKKKFVSDSKTPRKVLTGERLEELKNFRKTFEERKKVWEERLEKSKREREIRFRREKIERHLSNKFEISEKRGLPKPPTKSELRSAKRTGSLSNYRDLLKKSSEPIREAKVRKDLDRRRK